MPISEMVLILMLLLAIGMIMAGLFHKLPIPYTVLLVCVGIFLSELSEHWHFLSILKDFQLTPELVLFIFLPTLIFESGLNLNSRQLIKDIAPVLALAVPALLCSSFIIALGMWFFISMDFITALIFGALISATDPVAVISLFKELGTSERLTTLVEGESLFNDATAIVLFNILLGIALYGGFSWSQTGDAVFEFFKVFFGGVVIGVLLGLIASWLINKLPLDSSAVLVLSLVLAYSSFIIAEHVVHVSGVMAVVAASIYLGIFAIPSVAKETSHALGEIWEFLALVCNTLLFLLVGLSISFATIYNHLGAIFVAIILVVLARASMIYTLIPSVTHLFHLPKITLNEQHIMWWGGLKGGLAIAIVLSIPNSMPGRELLISLTLGVVMYTLLVNAPSIRPLIKFFKLDKLSANESSEQAQSIEAARRVLNTSLKRLHEENVLSATGKAQIKNNYAKIFPEVSIHVSEEQQQKQHKLNALKVEQEALLRLYKMKIISGYVYVDLRSELNRAKEHIQNPERNTSNNLGRENNPFVRFEQKMIRWLREKNWAVSFLSYYQGNRLAQKITKNFTQILITQAAKKFVEKERDIEKSTKKQLLKHYKKRLGWFNDNLLEIKTDFPEFFASYETFFSSRNVLMRVRHILEKRGMHGLLSAKPLHILERQIDQAFETTIPLSLAEVGPNIEELLRNISLFQNLSVQAIEKLAQKVHKIYFLVGDVIIGEGERGDAVYFIIQGKVAVSHQGEGGEETVLASLVKGEFFGEMALYNDSKRTATVKALNSVSLLRLKREDVLNIAGQHPEIKQALENTNNT